MMFVRSDACDAYRRLRSSTAAVVCLLVLAACTPVTRPDFRMADGGAQADVDGGPNCAAVRCAGDRGARLPSLLAASSGSVRGNSEHFSLQLSAGMPQPIGVGESQRFRLRLGAPAPQIQAESP